MKKFTGFCFGLMMLSAGLTHAQIDKKLQLSLSTGYQKEDFHWSIAGNIDGQNPNVYSELKWKKLGGQNVSASAQWNVWKKITLYGSYNRQSIKSGSVNDTDYGSDNRGNPTYNETFNADEGHTQGWGLGAGYIIYNTSRFSLMPYLGYGVNQQSLHILDRSGNFANLNSNYIADWKGPFVKVISSGNITEKLKFTADLTYNQVTYHSKADWNLISSFMHPVSYRHHANGYGFDLGGRFVYEFTRHFGINAGVAKSNWQTGSGTDQLYLTSGEVDKTQLNEVVMKGFRVVGGVSLGW